MTLSSFFRSTRRALVVAGCAACLPLAAQAQALQEVTYLLPAPASSATRWTRTLTGFTGTRWQCWVAHVRDQTPGITW
ncbi:MAG TPA: hypothetical protein PKD73_05410, partial [Burkholderiaceae bacterium]|nr:hypothetical protein [Burkholderiaceae bacterium]